MASISRRVSIRYPQHTAWEPTSTLVLSTSKGYQVDIRLTTHGVAKPSLEWGFAALSSSTPLPTTHPLPEWDDNANWTIESLTPSRHAIWKHALDSRDVLENDEGDVFTVDDGTELEVGTGEMGRYEEIWRDEVLGDDPGFVALRCVWDGEDEDGDGDGKEWRGLCVRVGRYLQVVYRHVRDGGVRVERCFLRDISTDTDIQGAEGGREKEGEGDEKWEVQFESGPGRDVPRALRRELLSAKDWVRGREVSVAGVKWEVVDVNE